MCSRAERTVSGYLIDLMVKTAAPVPVLVYAGDAGFLAPPEAKRQTLKVASANWHASAALVAKRHGEALLVDIGTTTTDLIPVKAGKVAALWRDRQPSGSPRASWSIAAWCAPR